MDDGEGAVLAVYWKDKYLIDLTASRRQEEIELSWLHAKSLWGQRFLISRLGRALGHTECH